MLIGSFTENLTKAHKSRPASFVKSFSEKNRAIVKEAMKRVHHENCKYVLNALKSSSLEKVKCALEEGTALALERKRP